MTAHEYQHVFKPIKLGPVELPNRFYFSPHGTPLAVGSSPSDDFAYYYAERAAGGCGMVCQSLQAFPALGGRSSPWERETIPSFASMADLVHENGAKIFGELFYWWSAPGQWQHGSPPRPSFGPSDAGLFDKHPTVHALDTSEVRAFVEAHRRSAAHLREAGYDGIELHAAHGTMAEQFLSPYWNHRTDEYGGTPEKRLRFVLEMLEAVREAVGSDMCVGLRFNCDEMLPGGFAQDQAGEILSLICQTALVDFVDLDIAVEPNQFPLGMPGVFVDKHPYESFVKYTRGAAGSVPVMSVIGRLTSIAEADRIIGEGTCDMVGATRGLLAEPELMKNAREGREHRSRTCIACNWCMEGSRTFAATGCAINPAGQRERLWGVNTFQPAAESRKVVVVGGGPGGLEAARVAAMKGHEVLLLERKSTLGGQLALWAGLPGREEFMRSIEWWESELRELGVTVRTGAHASADTVLAERPDAVIVATGARYASDGTSGFINLPIPGHEQPFVHSVDDVLEQGIRPSGRVVLLDDEGLNAGVGAAEVLAAAGAEVVLVTRWMTPVSDSLIYALEFPFLIGRLKVAGVDIRTETYLKEIGPDRVTLFDVFTNDETVVEGVDAVVLCTMRVPQAGLSEALRGRVDQLFTIGDANGARPMATAPWEGHKFARMIGEPDAPKTFIEAYFNTYPEVRPKPASTLRRSAVVRPR